MKLNTASIIQTVSPAIREHWPLILGTFLYVLEAWMCLKVHKTGGMIMFVGYTIGNIGILVTLVAA
jgi:hypothetical protein